MAKVITIIQTPDGYLSDAKTREPWNASADELVLFAQLVAMECADLRIFPAINSYPAGSVAELKAYRAGIEHLRGAIRDRFGIKE